MDDSILTKLPAELRNDIYELSLISDGVIKVSENCRRLWTAPALLQCCKQIRSEASHIYYGSNTFRIDCRKSASDEQTDNALAEWLLVPAAADRSLITRLQVDDMYLGPGDVDDRVEACWHRISACGVTAVQAEIFVEVLYGDEGEKEGWVSSSRGIGKTK